MNTMLSFMRTPLLGSYLNDFNESPLIDIDTLKTVETLIEDDSLDDLFSINNNFKGMMIVKIHPEGDVKISYKNKKITDYDKRIITDWILEKNHKTYTSDFYRLDLEYYIFIFKVYKFNANIMLIGHVLDNNVSSKVDLMQIRQDTLTMEMKKVNGK